ncbi:MAG TPA: helix-turn-helix transcriptional regulator [Magnetospirillum sp.]|nr:helix-turn-helix transcriptional regulator [Magnetospirillum sp.]
MPKTIWTQRHSKLRALLIQERKTHGLTQADVAQRLGRPQSFVAKYERGERRVDVVEFLDLAAIIGFDPHALISALEEGE